jgi:hypothetical protein
MATDKITEVPLDESRGKFRIGFNEHGETLRVGGTLSGPCLWRLGVAPIR